jgi:hypothetical protein
MEGSPDPTWIVKLRNLREMPLLSMVSSFLRHRNLYDQPVVEKVVIVTLANCGKRAAHLVTGWVHLDAKHLEPIKPFGGNIVSLENGHYRVAVIGAEGITLAPRRSLSLRVIVAVLTRERSISILYDFTSSEGNVLQGSQEVST